ncbi:MAG: hypothetical protein V8T86_09750 [Victivallis sp.]
MSTSSRTTEAGVILVCPDLESAASDKHTLIVTDHVDYAFATVVAVFAEKPPVERACIRRRSSLPT